MLHGIAGLRSAVTLRVTLYEACLLRCLLLRTELIDHAAVHEPFAEAAPLLQRRATRSSSRYTVSTSARSSPDELLKHSLRVLPAHAKEFLSPCYRRQAFEGFLPTCRRLTLRVTGV